ncbi:SulP family inorganic anion transporter [Desulforhopalus sp. 52FAK]
MNGQQQTGPSEGIWQKVCRFVPGIKALSRYQPSWLGSDVAAGLSVAAVALPVGVAYSDLVGVPAVYGIYSAIFPLLAYALFGSSRQLMVGPDGPLCLLVASSLALLAGGDPTRYLSLMVAMTLLTGVFLVVAGFFRLGFIANFLSQPILTGYLTGASLIIMVGQLPKLLGIPVEASGFFPKVAQLANRIGQVHLPTLILGVSMIVVLLVLRRLTPSLPGALIVSAAGGIAVATLHLQDLGVAVLGQVPGGLPQFHLPSLEVLSSPSLLRDAAGVVLMSFTSGMLTVKSFARRNHYDVDANQELIAFGACNIASGIGQGFPVTGTGSRTAVNDAMGGKSQLVGIVAAAVMFLVLLFFTAPLAFVPVTVLAAVIIVASSGLLDFAALRDLSAISRRELALCLSTTIGVLVFGMLPGILLAIILSLMWLLSVASHPTEEVLGKIPDQEGFHSVTIHPNTETIPGLLLYRFDSSLVFFNVDAFRDGLLKQVSLNQSKVEWVVVDASNFNVIDATAVSKIDELREEFQATGIQMIFAGLRHDLSRFFKSAWTRKRYEAEGRFDYPTMISAIEAFREYNDNKSTTGRQ